MQERWADRRFIAQMMAKLRREGPAAGRCVVQVLNFLIKGIFRMCVRLGIFIAWGPLGKCEMKVFMFGEKVG